MTILPYPTHRHTQPFNIPCLCVLCAICSFTRICYSFLLVLISGIEGHTIVRDLFTTHHEQQQRRAGILSGITLSTESARVDAVVNTIG